MDDGAVPFSVTPAQVEELCSRGAAPDEIVRLLVATGAWSEAGAAEIVSTLYRPAHESGSAASAPAWPGPPDDPPPLFAA
jgi:hypothetical protein